HVLVRDIPSFPTRRSSDLPRALMTDADEAGRHGLQGVEHFARRRTQPEVRMADDRRTGAVGAIKTACPLRGDAIDELDFADRLRSEEHTSELQSRENLVCR